MPATIYRYRWRGCNLNEIKQNIDPSIIASLVAAMPKAWMDVSLDPGPPGSPAQIDLDEIMLSMGWIPFSVDPVTPLRAVTTKQELFQELTVDTNIASLIFIPVLTIPITTDAGFLDIQADISALANIAANFILTLDGVPIANGGNTIGIGVGGNMSIFKRVPITPGAHTVELQAKVTGIGAVSINPVTDPDGQHASLFVKEVVS